MPLERVYWMARSPRETRIRASRVEAKLAEAQKVHDKLQSNADMRWFLYGAGKMVLGWILGNVMGSRRKKGSSALHR
jgi:hypothetical protein